MKVYLDLLRDVMENGVAQNDRTGIGTRSVFGRQVRFDLQKGFPLLTTKKVHFKSVAYELLWFLRGDTNTKYLNDHGVRIWNEWADENGNLGPVYGKQWTDWEGPRGSINQIKNAISEIKANPSSRRLIVNAWNVGDLDKMALPPCHMFFQFSVANDKLSCQLYQRSADIFLGVPFNIASYALLTMMVAHVTDLVPHEFVHTFGDLHLYNNHVEQATLQLTREPKPLPHVKIHGEKDIFKISYEAIEISNYDPHPAIKAQVAV